MPLWCGQQRGGRAASAACRHRVHRQQLRRCTAALAAATGGAKVASAADGAGSAGSSVREQTSEPSTELRSASAPAAQASLRPPCYRKGSQEWTATEVQSFTLQRWLEDAGALQKQAQMAHPASFHKLIHALRMTPQSSFDKRQAGLYAAVLDAMACTVMAGLQQNTPDAVQLLKALNKVFAQRRQLGLMLTKHRKSLTDSWHSMVAAVLDKVSMPIFRPV
jgi:hypothetical protein